jgi:DNA-binding response OmpR family regulator
MSNARKILIIDDDDELRESLSEQLTLHEEFDTSLAATASEGLKQARSGHVDLVLLDVGLPDLDGREACKLLRRGGFKGFNQKSVSVIIELTDPRKQDAVHKAA